MPSDSFLMGFVDELRKLADETAVEQQETERQEPDNSQADDPSPRGDLAGLDTREDLQEKLKSPEGRASVRETYDGLRGKIDDLIGVRKAFTRSLLRARSGLFGSSVSPREDLKRILYRDEPFVDVRPA